MFSQTTCCCICATKTSFRNALIVLADGKCLIVVLTHLTMHTHHSGYTAAATSMVLRLIIADTNADGALPCLQDMVTDQGTVSPQYVLISHNADDTQLPIISHALVTPYAL